MPSVPLFASHHIIVQLFVQVIQKCCPQEEPIRLVESNRYLERICLHTAWMIIVSTLSGLNFNLYLPILFKSDVLGQCHGITKDLTRDKFSGSDDGL